VARMCVIVRSAPAKIPFGEIILAKKVHVGENDRSFILATRAQQHELFSI
jgi:hypothetical protein